MAFSRKRVRLHIRLSQKITLLKNNNIVHYTFYCFMFYIIALKLVIPGYSLIWTPSGPIVSN